MARRMGQNFLPQIIFASLAFTRLLGNSHRLTHDHTNQYHHRNFHLNLKSNPLHTRHDHLVSRLFLRKHRRLSARAIHQKPQRQKSSPLHRSLALHTSSQLFRRSHTMVGHFHHRLRNNTSTAKHRLASLCLTPHQPNNHHISNIKSLRHTHAGSQIQRQPHVPKLRQQNKQVLSLVSKIT